MFVIAPHGNVFLSLYTRFPDLYIGVLLLCIGHLILLSTCFQFGSLVTLIFAASLPVSTIISPGVAFCDTMGCSTYTIVAR